MRIRKLCVAVRCGLLAGVVSAAASPAAFARDDAEDGAARDARVRVITREELASSGFVTVADVLQRLPQFGAARGPTFNGFGDGEHHVDLRDLGAARTLILVNGRRWVASLDGGVDLTAIPFGAVDHVEIDTLGDGARAGSSAIGGTINIVLLPSFEGAEARAWVGENEHGDERAQHYDFSVGSATDRASVVVNVSYAKQEPVLAGDRAISSVVFHGLDPHDTTQGASPNTPYGRFDGLGIPGTVVLIPGEDGRQRSDFRAFDPTTDGYNTAPDNYLLTPSERYGAYANARFALDDGINFHTTLLYTQRSSQQRFAPYPLTLGSVMFPAGSPSAIEIPANNAFNPFGVTINRIQYRNSIAPRLFNQNADTFDGSAGIDGSFTLFDREWQWDLTSTYTERDVHYESTGVFSLGRLRLGLGPSFFDAAGNAVCGTPSAPIAGCVPINVFGGPNGFTQAMFDYVDVRTSDAEHESQRMHTASLHGSIADLPAGALTVDAGYDYRLESGFASNDATRETAGFALGDTRARQSIDEAHVALGVPLLKDITLARALDLTVAARHVELDSNADAHGSDTLFSANVDWKVDDHFGLEAGYFEGARAPSIAETSDSSGVARTLAGFDALGFERSRTTHVGAEWAARGENGPVFALGWTRTRVRDPIEFAITSGLTADGQIFEFQGYRNGALETTVETYDASATYGFATPIGAFGLRFDGSYLADFHDASYAPRYVGNYFDSLHPLHRVRANLLGTWNRNDFAAHLGVRYRSGLDESCDAAAAGGHPELCANPEGSPSFPGSETHAASTTYVDTQVDWRAPWNSTLSLGVRNLFDRDPPVSYSTENNFPPHLEVPGRFFYAAYTQKF